MLYLSIQYFIYENLTEELQLIFVRIRNSPPTILYLFIYFCRNPDKKRFFFLSECTFFFFVAGPMLWESLLTVTGTFLRGLMVGFKILMWRGTFFCYLYYHNALRELFYRRCYINLLISTTLSFDWVCNILLDALSRIWHTGCSLARQNRRHFATLPLVFLQNNVWKKGAQGLHTDDASQPRSG